MAPRFTAPLTRLGHRKNALPDRYASDELVLRDPSDGGTLAQRLTKRYSARITGAFVVPGREGSFAPFPDDLPPALTQALCSRGIDQLYSHQAEAWAATQSGAHVAIVTPTASGKSLCYTLPVITVAMTQHAKALYLFPTKALAQDQVAELLELNQAGGLGVKAFTFDDGSQLRAGGSQLSLAALCGALSPRLSGRRPGSGFLVG